MKFENDIPVEEEGLGDLKTVSFSGGRLSVDLANHGGLFNVRYYGRQRFCGTKLYQASPLSSWTELFRISAVIDGDAYYLEFTDTHLYPFGYRSSCTMAGVTFVHELFVLNNAMHFRITVVDNPEGRSIVIRQTLNETGSKVTAPFRTWQTLAFSEEKNAFLACAEDAFHDADSKDARGDALAVQITFKNREPGLAQTWVGLTGNTKIRALASHPRFHRIVLDADYASEPVIFSAVFAADNESFEQRLRTSQQEGNRECDDCFAAWQKTIREQPEISCENAVVQSAMANTRPALESLMVKDIPGGMRAADSNYWIWGWDTMVNPEAHFLSNDFEFPRQVLDYYKRTADPELGIFHANTLDERPYLAMANAPQTLYCILLYKHFCHVRDRAVVETYYGFAFDVITRAMGDAVGDTGLLQGVGMYPDFPEDLDQDGHDISSFNNSIYYQALKAMAVLAELLGRDEDQRLLETTADTCLASIKTHLYDHEKGYFYDSISSQDLSPRRHYPNYAVLWVSPFAQDLVEFDLERIATFMADNLTAPFMPRILPKWDAAWMLDGNQLGMAMPAVEKFYREMMRLSGRVDKLTQWFDTVEYFWSKLTVPEAITCRVENRDLTPDCPGRKQGHAIKPWYSIFMETICGIQVDHTGVSFCPPAVGNVKINNLKYGDQTLDIVIDNDKAVWLNGKRVGN
jgi:hypothetical protein